MRRRRARRRRKLQEVPNRSTRANFLRTLPELIGPPPARSWTEEWAALSTAFLQMSEEDSAIGRQLAEMSADECAEYINGSPIYSLETVMSDGETIIAELVAERQWEREHAEAYALLYPLRAPLSRSLAERRGDFAASIYALSEALASASARAAGSAAAPLLPVYKHLHGPNGLIEADAAWARLLEPDGTGFRGLTSSALVVATRDRRCFTPDGFRNGTVGDDGAPRYDLMASSDVVCIEASPADATAFHAAVMINELFGALPPNTLFRLKRIVPPGAWEVDGVVVGGDAGAGAGAATAAATAAGAGSGAATTAARSLTPRAKMAAKGRAHRITPRATHKQPPTPTPTPAPPTGRAGGGGVGGGTSHALDEAHATVRPMQRLLVVSCTFRPPKDPERPLVGLGGAASSGKFGAHVTTLQYASREAYIGGLDDIIAQPPLSLAQEYDRSLSWIDFRGDRYNLRDEWAYATGVARPSTMPGGRRRDWDNGGKAPEDFQRAANAMIARRRRQLATISGTGGGGGGGGGGAGSGGGVDGGGGGAGRAMVWTAAAAALAAARSTRSR